MRSLRDYLFWQESQLILGKPAHISPEKIVELREKIRGGEVDIGPFPDHSAPVKDRRPTGDAEAIGQAILAKRNGSGNSGFTP